MSLRAGSLRRRPWHADLLVGAVVALAVFGPLLTSTGYWLVGDMVFVPRQPWKPEWLGLDGALPRAVPMDALISAATQVLPGWVVQRVLLIGGFLVGALGVGRLVADAPWYARAAGITIFLWNPWVHDHLQIGQWAILSGYLVLPWVALAARGLRADARRAWPTSVLVLTAAAVCSPSSGITAVAVLAVLSAADRWRTRLSRLAVVGALGVLANLPWLVPALVATPASAGSSGAFDVFAARGESSLGVIASLFSLGGTWKTSIVAGERTSAVIVVVAALLTLAALAGLTRRARAGAPTSLEARRLGWTALGAIVVAAAAPLGADGVLAGLADVVPGVAMLRDSHRYLAPAGLALAVGAVEAVTWLRARVAPGREAVWAGIVAMLLAPVVLLPSLAWGGAVAADRGGSLRPVHYPDSWFEVRDHLEGQRAELADDPVTVVLPWSGGYRGFGWNHGRAVLDPAPRFLPGRVLVDDRTFVDGAAVPGEDPRLDAVVTALGHEEPAAMVGALRALGVTGLLVESGEVPDGVSELGSRLVFGDAAEPLVLVELAPLPRDATRMDTFTSHSASPAMVVGADLLVVATALVSGVLHLTRGRTRRRFG
ncbi:hypothetical protein [Nocardioides sp. R-C-SC26]|uniref:hypothetical protein n=1 Tax=Nocardioides sp. R-C-SC26 TaxID=2870414 RepID=UPI001E4C4495|nr:hypothetical protein [Nocardioides sp. R-C-SC26]